MYTLKKNDRSVSEIHNTRIHPVNWYANTTRQTKNKEYTIDDPFILFHCQYKLPHVWLVCPVPFNVFQPYMEYITIEMVYTHTISFDGTLN